MTIKGFIQHLTKTLKYQPKKYDPTDLYGQFVFVDVYQLCFRYASITDDVEKVRSLFLGLVNSLLNARPEKLVLVTEGKNIPLKEPTMAKRRETCVEHNREIFAELSSGGYIRNVILMSPEITMHSSIEVVTSSFEDYGCLEYAEQNGVEKMFIVSNDTDFLIYGGGNFDITVITNYSYSSKGKENIKTYNNYEIVCNYFDKDFTKLINYALILQNDYNVNYPLKQIGPSRAYQLTLQYSCIEDIINDEEIFKKFNIAGVPEGYLSEYFYPCFNLIITGEF